MRDIRPAVGMALGASMLLILLAGAVAHSTRELWLIFGGFACGLVTACLVDTISAARARAAERHEPQADLRGSARRGEVAALQR